MGFFKKIYDGLAKTRKSLSTAVDNVFKNFRKIDDEFFEELEEALILADCGALASAEIIDELREKVKKEKINEVDLIRPALIELISEKITSPSELEIKSPTVIMIIGVNGVGKTTTIGKLASIYTSLGKKVVIAAGDTFRAAAIEQLEVWANRAGATLIKHSANSDPGAVVFDAVASAKARGADILLIDTAGRLQNKKNLMAELNKCSRIVEKEFAEAHRETFLVLDAVTGQNAISQAKEFNEIAKITGIVLTKLDGTAKGGIVISILSQFNIPIRYIGVGEGINDLMDFVPEDFAKSLFQNEESSNS